MIVDSYPLSPMQEGMLFHSLLEQGSGVDVQQLVADFCEPLRVAEFKEAWKRVISRHPILRTDFRWTHVEQPIQQVHATVELPWLEEDCRELAPVDLEQRLQCFLSADRRRGLDMARAPLFRLAVFHVRDGDTRFVWTVHHALLDGRSIAIVMREILVFYQALRRGEEPMVSLPRPYRDYIDWLQIQDFGKSEAFWRRALTGHPARSSLRASDGAAATLVESSRGGPEARMPTDVTSALRRLARANEVTLNTLVQGAWAILLSRYSDQSDVLFGVVRACRSALPGAQAMAGPFSNTLPLRIRVDPDAALLPWLRVLHAQWKAMRGYEHTPLGKLRAWSDAPPATPLFETIIMFENFHLDAVLQPPGEARLVRELSLVGQSIYSFNLLAYDGAELRLQLACSQHRGDAIASGQMLQHLKTLLEEIASDPQRKLRELPLMTSMERNKLLRDWNNTAVSYPADLCLHELFERQVDLNPEAIALIFANERLTYREVNHRANKLALNLRSAGIGPGVLVGVFMQRSTHLLVALLGVLKAGAAYVPLDPTYPADRIAFMLRDAEVNVVLSQNELAGSLPLAGLDVILLDETPWAAGAAPVANPSRNTTDASLAYVMYTSGSTGPPKGVMISHRAIVNNILWMRSTFPMDARDRVLQKTEFSFDPSVWELFLPLAVGAQLVIPRPSEGRTPEDLLRFILEHRITILNCVASFLNLLLENPEFARCNNLRHCFCGGEVMSVELARRFYQLQSAELHNMYGPTEVTITSLAYSVPRVALGEVIPIGRPVANTQAYVLDRHGEPVPVGVEGELYLAGAQLAEGYYHRPGLTAERFLRVPGIGLENALLFRTGDKVRLRSDANIEFLGRADQQVKFRGYRIELGEIETVLRAHAKVRDCVVALHKTATGQQRLVAYVSARDTSPASASDLRTHVKKSLPAHMIPDRFLLLDALPSHANGKVDRQALPLPEERDRWNNHYYPPRTPMEEHLACIWRSILQCQDIGIHDDFFEIGGHSLAAVRLVSAINRKLNANLGVADVFARPTIEQLAGALTARLTQEHVLPTVVTLHEGAADPPIYFIGPDLFRLAPLVRGLHSIFGIDGPWRDALNPHPTSPRLKLEQLVEPSVSTVLAHMRSSRCVLVGYSFGGLIAFEIAHQLQARRRKVELVILLDTLTKHANPCRQIWCKWQNEWKYRVSPSQFWRDLGAGVLRRVTFKAPSLVLDGASEDMPWHLTDKSLARLQRSYQLRRIESRGVFFRAQEAHNLATTDWRGLFSRGLEVRSVPGDHYSMLRMERNLQTLASEMRSLLERELANVT